MMMIMMIIVTGMTIIMLVCSSGIVQENTTYFVGTNGTTMFQERYSVHCRGK